MSDRAATFDRLRSALAIAERTPVGGGLVRVVLDAGPVAASYERPGQYVRLALGEEAGYFALAGPPGERAWELVVRDAGGASRLLLDAPLGTRVDVDAVLGAGFDDAVVASPSLLVVAVGSGVAVARAVLAARQGSAAGARRAALYFGVRDADDVPFADELVGVAAETDVVLCASRRTASPVGLPVRKGWVQAVLTADLEAGRVALGCDVVAVGPAGLLADLRELERHGRIGTVHTNY